MIIPFVLILCGLAQAPVNDALDKPRLETWLAAGDHSLIVQVFRRHSDGVLPFIDDYLEGGLKMIEEGKPEHEALSSFRTGVRFARLADEALGGTAFADYASSFASWSPTERKRFREGQAEFRTGRAENSDAEKALAHYTKSLKLAEPLGDAWGTAMALGGIAESLVKLGRRAEALEYAWRAASLNEWLHLRKAQIAATLTALDAGGVSSLGPAPIVARLETLLRDDDDPDFKRGVAQRCAALLRDAGQKDAADDVIRRYGLAAPPTTQPAKP